MSLQEIRADFAREKAVEILQRLHQSSNFRLFINYLLMMENEHLIRFKFFKKEILDFSFGIKKGGSYVLFISCGKTAGENQREVVMQTAHVILEHYSDGSDNLTEDRLSDEQRHKLDMEAAIFADVISSYMDACPRGHDEFEFLL